MSASLWLSCASGLSLLLFAGACSSGSAGPADGGSVDASTTDAADAASVDTGAGDDSAASVDSGAGDDSSATADGPSVPCHTQVPCGLHGACCLGTTSGTCAPTCGCEVALTCASGADCQPNQFCCLVPTTVGCSAGTRSSVCLSSCFGTGYAQLCVPSDAGQSECMSGSSGSCSSDNAALAALGIPADAGFGLCH